jgi:hypothetical protein
MDGMASVPAAAFVDRRGDCGRHDTERMDMED